ncbi:MAG: DUF4388 domain-containing protein [Myxococcota bacterium]
MRDAASELVRIDERGEAHPIGAVASQRMRARQGAYRVMPAPEHVVFMRFTGEDGRRDAGDGAIVRLAGEVTEPAALCDIFAMLTHTRWRGELQVQSTEARRSIFTESGYIVGATTTQSDERIGQVMFRYGALTRDQVDDVLQAMETSGKRFGETAVELGLIQADGLFHYLGRQLEEIVFGAFAGDDGTFFFLEGFDDGRLTSHHSISASAVLMDGVTRLDEIKYFRQKIPSAEWIPVPTGKGEPGGDLGTVFAAVDGQRDVAAVGRQSGLGEFETTKALYALAQSKHVELHPPRMDGGPRAIVSAANAALRAVHQRVDAAGHGTSLRESLETYATGNGVYDVLFYGAGPDERGTLDPDQVEVNLARVAGDDEDSFLRRKMHDYVSFAVFSAESMLTEERSRELRLEVGPILNRLQPSA